MKKGQSDDKGRETGGNNRTRDRVMTKEEKRLVMTVESIDC